MKRRYWLFLLPLFLFSYEYTLSLGEFGDIRYVYDDTHLVQIDRLSMGGEVLYSHSYRYNEGGFLVSERLIGDLGEIIYEEGGVSSSPYNFEECKYNEDGNLVRHVQDNSILEYSYNHLSEIVLEDRREDFVYDEQGRLIRSGDAKYFYEDDLLVKVVSNSDIVVFDYNESRQRVSKTLNGVKESYLFLGNNEIAIFDQDDNLKQLRIPGLSINKDLIRPIAIETEDAVFAPIHNKQGNIVKLINIKTHDVIELSKAGPFGKGLSKTSPVAWIFSGKHYNPEIDLVYFGSRFYSPAIGKWLTRDPLKQTPDLHQYCFNNPFTYYDPDGNFAITFLEVAWGAGTAISCPAWGPYALAGAAAGYLAHEGYKYYKKNHPKLDHNEDPPFTFDDLGNDPSKCPGEGFEWKGRGEAKDGMAIGLRERSLLGNT